MPDVKSFSVWLSWEEGFAVERIFSVLAAIAIVMLGANFVAGLSIGDFSAVSKDLIKASRELRTVEAKGDSTAEQKETALKSFDEADAAFRGPRSRMTFHFFLGVGSTLLAILVNSITVTYFIGTSRWCKEVVDTFSLNPSLAQEGADLKRRAFPFALMGMLTMVVIVTLGAKSDPSVPFNRGETAAWVNYHYMSAITGMLLLIFFFYMQAQRIADNYRLIQRILAEVEKVRALQGNATNIIPKVGS